MAPILDGTFIILSAVWFWGTLGAFLVSTVVLVILLWRRFAKPTWFYSFFWERGYCHGYYIG